MSNASAQVLFALVIVCGGGQAVFTTSAWAQDPPYTTDGRSYEELCTALDHEDDKVRRLAAYEIGKRRPQSAEVVKKLLATLGDVDAEVRRGAIWSLGQVDRYHDWATPALLKCLAEEPRAKNRWEAVRALGELGPEAKDAIPAIESVARGGRGSRDIGPYLATRQIQPLATNHLIRADAIRALGKIGNEEAIGLLLILLIRGEKEIAAYGMPYYILSAEALGRIGKADPRVIQALARGRRLAGGTEQTEKVRLAADSALRQIEKAQAEIGDQEANAAAQRQ